MQAMSGLVSEREFNIFGNIFGNGESLGAENTFCNHLEPVLVWDAWSQFKTLLDLMGIFGILQMIFKILSIGWDIWGHLENIYNISFFFRNIGQFWKLWDIRIGFEFLNKYNHFLKI